MTRMTLTSTGLPLLEGINSQVSLLCTGDSMPKYELAFVHLIFDPAASSVPRFGIQSVTEEQLRIMLTNGWEIKGEPKWETGSVLLLLQRRRIILIPSECQR